ncbi:hypothetical protein [Burkholderia ambifaria]|uniref:Reverse transcriptase domain-containing protein n=1 Tax=Burkholderia ambifaria MEX-5 TaxID=396597 RepID=B1TF46_9BURK|nr:hypothetical protein [Burkholderia ambifaria]EDT37805.1 hypothetical protein BamMEX5DRAFT_6412 [Burkholderia ambifaria MEX-5]
MESAFALPAWNTQFGVKAAFDKIDLALFMKAMRHYIKDKWILSYIVSKAGRPTDLRLIRPTWRKIGALKACCADRLKVIAEFRGAN